MCIFWFNQFPCNRPSASFKSSRASRLGNFLNNTLRSPKSSGVANSGRADTTSIRSVGMGMKNLSVSMFKIRARTTNNSSAKNSLSNFLCSPLNSVDTASACCAVHHSDEPHPRPLSLRRERGALLFQSLGFPLLPIREKGLGDEVKGLIALKLKL